MVVEDDACRNFLLALIDLFVYNNMAIITNNTEQSCIIALFW
jgi:hypothetical protein